MASEPEQQTDKPSESPGALLRAARERLELSEREAADRLNWMPGYVAIVEQDNYAALSRPSFARGYVKAYGSLVGLKEEQLMATFDAMGNQTDLASGQSVNSVPPPLQKTGVGIAVSLGLLSLLVMAMWWWNEGSIT